MPNFNDLFKDSPPVPDASTPVEGTKGPHDELTLGGSYSDEELLELWQDIRQESFTDRWVFERQWLRNIYYVLGRQWIEYNTAWGGWRDKRMARWIPRPVTNKCKETVQALRAMLVSIKLGAIVRPNGADPVNVSAAATADDLAPLIHEDHGMDQIMSEFYFWILTLGNAFLHTFIEYDLKYGELIIQLEQCVQCGSMYPSNELEPTAPVCKECGGTEFVDAVDPETGEPIQKRQAKGKPVTIPLSPLELAFPNSYARFSDLPYVVRMRWRTKRYFQNHPVLKELVPKISWQKAPADRSLQIFKSLSTYNDLGITPTYSTDDGHGSGEDSQDGAPEFEVWYKPCDKYPEGLVFRVVGDRAGVIVHLEETEAIPGPLPYKDAEGTPLFTFTHAGFEHVGGRIIASGPLDVMIQKQDQLNRLDSMILLIIQRMSNPVWLEPKGAEIEKLTGMPGLVIKWNPLTVGGNAKPERIEGVGPHASLFTIREQYLKDIEELTGTFDIIKGAKPTGIEAFSALQLLVERSQSRFALLFQSVGSAYKDWLKYALELEREFGPEERTKAVLTPARSWAFQNFKRSQLQGSISVVVEDGSNVPKTALGMRAAVEHASQLQMLNMQDPDQQYEALKLFGLTRMVPTLDIHVQAAVQKQQAFEEWAKDEQKMQQSFQKAEQEVAQYQQSLEQVQPSLDPAQPAQLPPPPSMTKHTPLAWKRWYNPVIHRQEFLKWANGDKVRELLQTNPGLESLLDTHLQEIEGALVQQQMMMAPPQPGQPAGAGAGMANSNRESTQGNEPRGSGEGAQNAGPR